MSAVTIDPLARVAVRVGSALERWGRARVTATPDREALRRAREHRSAVEARLVAAERLAPRIR